MISLFIVIIITTVMIGFELPGEAQMVDRFCEKFGTAWGSANGVESDAALLLIVLVLVLVLVLIIVIVIYSDTENDNSNNAGRLHLRLLARDARHGPASARHHGPRTLVVVHVSFSSVLK